MKKSMLLGFPLRGAISIGNIFSHKREYETKYLNSTNVIVGKPIIECYKIEKSQQWSGCVIDETCIKLLQNHPQVDESLNLIQNLEEKKFLCKYHVPYKTRKREKEYVINWVFADNYPIPENLVIKSFSEYNKLTNTSSAEKIIGNTLDFYKFNFKTMK